MKRMKIIVKVFTLLLVLSVFSVKKDIDLSANDIKDERELKAVWMSSFIGEAPYENENQFKNYMNSSLDVLEYYGINALIFHVRTHNNAFYDSDLNPKASFFKNADFDVFDPLTWLIDETHRRGIEFHAWMNPYRYSTTYQTGSLPASNPQNDPSNLIVESGGSILNPAKEVVREHIFDTISEFIYMYPTVDAIHFDDYFYISTSVAPNNDDLRRKEVDKLIEGIHNVLTDFNEEHNTAIQFGISPTGAYKNGNGVVTYDSNGNPITNGSNTNAGLPHYHGYLYADTLKWSIEGWIDYIMPQTYWARNNPLVPFTNLIDWWDKAYKYLDTNVYAGLGVYMSDNTGTYNWVNNMQELDGQLSLLNTKENVLGYSIYSYKHLLNGYNNSNLNSGKQIRNAYLNEERRNVKVIPVVKTINPILINEVKNIKTSNNVLSWDSVNGGKFYYIYKSDGVITYSTDEIVGVVGHNDGVMSYDLSNLGSGNFSVRAISATNHFSPVNEYIPLDHAKVEFNLGYNSTPPSYQIIEKGERAVKPFDPVREGYKFVGWYLGNNVFNFNTQITDDLTLTARWEELEVYNITYNLFGGSLKDLGYETREEVIVDFLTDFYNFLNPNISLNDFMHGVGKTSGYDGLYNEELYFKYLYEENNKTVNPTTGKFINQQEYNKWVPLLDLMEEYTSTGNKNQTGQFWGMPLVVGIARIKPFIRQINLWPYQGQTEISLIMSILNKIPEELKKVSIVYNFTEESDDIILPIAHKDGYEFLGWYNNSSFTGNKIEVINGGTKGDVNLYANFSSLSTEEVIVSFDLGYDNLKLPEKVIYKGDKVTQPTNPVRNGYIFTGWYLSNSLFDFNSDVNGSITLTARWEEVNEIEYVKVYFDLGYDDLFLNTLTIEKGSLTQKPANPIRENYSFLGWYFGNELYNFNLPVEEDIILKAKWEEKVLYEEVIIYFDLGYDALYLPSVTIEKGTNFKEPYLPVREGYLFIGWFLDGHLFDFNNLIYDNLTFVANWKSDGAVKEYVISFSLGYDDLMLPFVLVEEGAKVVAPEKPEREGYLFAGWYYGLRRFDFKEDIYEDYLLVAKWNEKITVTNNVLTLDGASIRKTYEAGVQRLRFYGKIDSSLIGQEFGFYAIYGVTTPEFLMDEIRNSTGSKIYINGQDVKKQAVNKADYNNEFSVVLTGIPKIGYADKLTVIAYAVDRDGNLYLSNKATTRSVLEVAVKMEEANDGIDESKDIINYVKSNMYKLDYDAYGNLQITKGLYDGYHGHLKDVFFSDWNKKFNETFINPSANEFFLSAMEGSNDAYRNNTNLSSTNIYKFFNDPLMKDKWGWFLDYIKSVDYTIHTTGQIEAIKGNGTYRNPNLSSNNSILYNGTHFIHSIYNFFYEANENSGYPAINFTLTTPHPDDLMTKYDRYNKILDYNNKIYIDVNNHNIFKIGDTIKLPKINLSAPSGSRYVYFDGINYIAEESLYTVRNEVNFEVKLVVDSVYSISYFDNGVELLELSDYYLTNEGKKLPVLTKEGYNFIGWYNNPSLTGSIITTISLGSSGAKSFYAKFEKANTVLNITYDFGAYGYHTVTKSLLFEDFRKDYKEFYNLSDPIGGTIHDFFHNSKLKLPNKIEEIFLDSTLGAKWDFIEDYILIKAAETNYLFLEELENYNEEVWRLNIQAFFTDVLYTNETSTYVSMDFRDLNLANSFWKYTKYNSYEASYNYSDSLVTSDAVKSWNNNYEFIGWTLNSNIINDLSELEPGTYVLKALWRLK